MFGDRRNQHILKGGMDLFSQNKTKISKKKKKKKKFGYGGLSSH
jgi:hypothetical protein